MRWYWALLIFLIAFSWYNHQDKFMDNPVGNTIDGAKQLVTKLSHFNSGNQTNYGKPNCIDNLDCNSISLCINNCTCISGECFK